MGATTMRTMLCTVALALVGCGGGGEPIEGTITIGYGDDTITPDVGAALETPESSPSEMTVIIGTRSIGCGLDLVNDDPGGTYVMFTVDSSAPAAHSSTSISVVKSTSTSYDSTGSQGDVVIAAIDAERISGSLTFTTDINEDVGVISVNGTFDVIRCF